MMFEAGATLVSAESCSELDTAASVCTAGESVWGAAAADSVSEGADARSYPFSEAGAADSVPTEAGGPFHPFSGAGAESQASKGVGTGAHVCVVAGAGAGSGAHLVFGPEAQESSGAAEGAQVPVEGSYTADIRLALDGDPGTTFDTSA